MELKNIEIKLLRGSTLPILPRVVTELLALIDNVNATGREYERVMMQDAALASKVLRTANSSYYGGNGNITTLQRAVSILGANTIRSICLTVSFQSAIPLKELSKRFNVGYFWQHSMAVACGAKILACLRHDLLAEEAFIAGLMHDIGKLALCLYLPVEAGLIFDKMEKLKISQYEAEEAFLEVTHQDIGLLAAKIWSLPKIYHGPIAHHHTPTKDVLEIDPLTAYVHIANAIAYEIGVGYAEPGSMNGMDPLVKEFLELSQEQYDPLRVTIANAVSRLSSQMGL